MSQNTVANCFRHAGFTTETVQVEDIPYDDPEDDIPLVRLASRRCFRCMHAAVRIGG